MLDVDIVMRIKCIDYLIYSMYYINTNYKLKGLNIG